MDISLKQVHTETNCFLISLRVSLYKAGNYKADTLSNLWNFTRNQLSFSLQEGNGWRRIYLWKTNTTLYTAWKVFVFGVFLVRVFPHSNWIRKDTVFSCLLRLISKLMHCTYDIYFREIFLLGPKSYAKCK